MSTPEATAFLKKSLAKEIDAELSKYTRGELDTLVHVIDISYESLLKSNARRNTATYRKNWEEFYRAAISTATLVPDYATALIKVNKNSGTCIIQEAGSVLVVSKNFNAARTFVTNVSRQIPTNEDFGISFRGRNLEDIETSRKLSRAKGSTFLIYDNGRYTVKKVEKLPGTNNYGLVPIDGGYSNVQEVYYLAQRRSVEYSVSNKLDQFANLEVDIDESGKIVIKKRLLSVLDLGHGEGELSSQSTPAGKKIFNILQLGLGAKGKALVQRYLKELRDLHNVVKFEFQNTSTDSSAEAYVVLSVQKYTRNNLLSISEANILRKIRDNISKILKDVPGSNTVIQDSIQLVANKLVKALDPKAKTTPVKKHAKVKGESTNKAKISSPTSGIKHTKATKQVTATAIRKPILQHQTGNLVNLQNLINSQLQDVISANMGDGDSRSILNYRTGRLAASARVERLSESREGMITAFYSYMKNPYATFSTGGRQSVPKTRDPKLLIAKSIREIAATQVANRMRAVAL